MVCASCKFPMPFGAVSDICPSCQRWNDGDREVDEDGAMLLAAAVIEQARADIRSAISATHRGKHVPNCDKTHPEWKCAAPLLRRTLALRPSLRGDVAHPTNVAATVLGLVRPIVRRAA